MHVVRVHEINLILYLYHRVYTLVYRTHVRSSTNLFVISSLSNDRCFIFSIFYTFDKPESML